MSAQDQALFLPWIEKYRPKTADGVHQQTEIVSALKHCIDQNKLPNLLFHGPPGTGKTSLILAVAHQLFKDDYEQRVLELNASDERGIKVVRDKIKKFSQYTAGNRTKSGKPCPPFKLIILDEVDNMTHAAQSALRRIIEIECQNTRFCLICNYLSKIISPIQSRCSKFRFKPLDVQSISKCLSSIKESESLSKISDIHIQLIIQESHGDMRKAVNMLQNLSWIIKSDSDHSDLEISKFLGALSPDIIDDALQSLRSGKFSQVEKFCSTAKKLGISVQDLLENLLDRVISEGSLNDTQKVKIMNEITRCEYLINDGADHMLVLHSALSVLC